MIDRRSEMCKKCIHTKVCFKDKNVCGDRFVAGNPLLFDNQKLWEKYEEREKNGFPRDDYFPEVVQCKDCKYSDTYADCTKATFPLKCLSIRYGGVYPYWYCEHGEKVTEF